MGPVRLLQPRRRPQASVTVNRAGFCVDEDSSIQLNFLSRSSLSRPLGSTSENVHIFWWAARVSILAPWD
jgi:hypothetical protein